jgi:hypothetical protein
MFFSESKLKTVSMKINLNPTCILTIIAVFMLPDFLCVAYNLFVLSFVLLSIPQSSRPDCTG